MSAAKKILFICVGNSFRSPMAEGFAREYGRAAVEVKSAGTSACGIVSDSVVEAMAEKSIDIGSQTSDQLTVEMIDWADAVVTLGCQTTKSLCPADFKGAKYDWPIEDPIGMPIGFTRKVRDEIESRVVKLVKELTKEGG